MEVKPHGRERPHFFGPFPERSVAETFGRDLLDRNACEGVAYLRVRPSDQLVEIHTPEGNYDPFTDDDPVALTD